MIHFIQNKPESNRINTSQITYSTSLEEAINALSPHSLLALDTETTSLDVVNPTLIMLQLGIENGDQYVFDMRQINGEALRSLLEQPNRTFIGHNIKFDYNVLKSLKMVLPKVYDTMVVDQVIHNGKYNMIQLIKTKRFSLAGVYKHYFNRMIDKETRQQFHTVHKRPFTPQQIMYGALDVVYPFQIRNEQLPLIEKDELQTCVDLENAVVLAIGDIEYNGFHVNPVKWMEINRSYKIRLIETIKALDALMLQQPVEKISKYRSLAYQKDLFDAAFEDRRETIINWSSDKQAYEILTEVFGIYPKDKDGKSGSGAKAIELLNKRYPITDLLLQLRREEKAISSFGEEYLQKYVGPDQRIRTSYNQIVETGRMSSRNPNLQQIPKTEAFRKAFEAPDNRFIVTADYAAQEARIMADRAQDESYIEFFNSGAADVHSFVATKMFSASFGREFIVTKDNENKEYRQKGKTLNFAISFGGSAFTLSKTLNIPKEEAQELIDSFFKGFPKLKALFDENKTFAMRNGYILTNDFIKRKRTFPDWEDYKKLQNLSYLAPDKHKLFMQLRGKIERRALNTPIQGRWPCLNSVNSKKAEMLILSQVL